jgi:membrane complex biogenesis BtpA family protein
MVHFPALPGRPLHDRDNGWDQLVDKVGRDVEVLQAAGVDGLLFCNEGDLPYQLAVGPEVPATMAAVIGSLKRDVHVPFGVNVLWDPMATLAVARATGAGFVREVLTGVYESDLGLLQPNCGDIWGYRAKIGAGDVAMFGNITPEFSSSLGTRSIADRARSAVFLGVQVVLISGPQAGGQVDLANLRDAKAAVGDVPVMANTGVRRETVAEILDLTDGVIVGTSLKREGVTWNEVDPQRARDFMETVRAVRAPTRPVHA